MIRCTLPVLVGITLQMPHSILVVLGQDYLPGRAGSAAAVGPAAPVKLALEVQ